MRTALLLAVPLFAAAAEKPTGVTVVGVLKKDAACATALRDAAERTLETLGASGGTARLAYAFQIRLALEEAKVPGPKAKDAVRMLETVAKDAGPLIPELAVTARFVDGNAKAKLLGFCALPRDCSLGRQPASHFAWTYRGGPGLLLAPVPGDEGLLRWAINYYGTLAMPAGEYYLVEWIRAAHRLEAVRAGSSDEYYRAYVSGYDGSFPPPPGILDQGFAQIVMRAFLTSVKTKTYAAYFPDGARANTEEARKGDYAHLVSQPEGKERAQALGITEANYLEWVDRILGTLGGTIVRARETN
jgi:hypothetical protein